MSEAEVEGVRQKKIQIIPLNLDLDLLFRISEAEFETSLLLEKITRLCKTPLTKLANVPFGRESSM